MDLAELKQRLDQEFSDFSFGKAMFPLLFQTGLDDAAVHSAGISYLLALGIELGVPAIAEYPISVHADEHWKQFGKLLPNSIWFYPQTQQPWIAFEFERFERGDELKIQDKARNLVLSYYQSHQTIEMCVLIYWLRSGLAPHSIDPVIRIFEQGFLLNNTQIPAPQCQLLLYKFVFCQAKSSVSDKYWQVNEPGATYSTIGEGAARLSICSATKVSR